MQHAEVVWHTEAAFPEFAELVLLTCLHLSLAGKPVSLKYSEQGDAVGMARGPPLHQGQGFLSWEVPFCISAQQCGRRGLVPSSLDLTVHCSVLVEDVRILLGGWGSLRCSSCIVPGGNRTE